MLTLGAAASNMGDMTGTQMKSPAYTFAALASQFKKENSIDVNDLAWHPLHSKCLGSWGKSCTRDQEGWAACGALCGLLIGWPRRRQPLHSSSVMPAPAALQLVLGGHSGCVERGAGG